MKNLFIFALTLALSLQSVGGKVAIGGKVGIGGGPSSAGSFTAVQTVTGFTGSSVTTIDLTVAATGSGNLLVLQVKDSNGGNYVTSVTTGCSGAWVAPSSSQQSNSGNSVSGSYCLSSASGVTSITINFNNARPYHYVFYEVSDTAGHTPSLDPSGGIGTSTYTSTTNPPGVALTLTGTNDAIFQVIAVSSGSVTGISSPYGNFNSLGGDGYGDSLNTTSGAAPTWTNATASIGSTSAFAFAAN
jgi:hypothetical protein